MVNAASAFVIFSGIGFFGRSGRFGLGISGNELFNLSTAAIFSVDPILPVTGSTNLVLPAIVSGLNLSGLHLSPRPSLTNLGVSTFGVSILGTVLMSVEACNLDTTSVPEASDTELTDEFND